jgi:hypothetical protein
MRKDVCNIVIKGDTIIIEKCLEYYSFYNNFLRTHVIVHMSATYAK